MNHKELAMIEVATSLFKLSLLEGKSLEESFETVKIFYKGRKQ
jgi:hypothetical protein